MLTQQSKHLQSYFLKGKLTISYFYILIQNERNVIFGTYLNYSTDYFHVVGKTTVSREQSCHMLKTSSVRVESDGTALTSNLNFIMTNIGQENVSFLSCGHISILKCFLIKIK